MGQLSSTVKSVIQISRFREHPQNILFAKFSHNKVLLKSLL